MTNPIKVAEAIVAWFESEYGLEFSDPEKVQIEIAAIVEENGEYQGNARMGHA